MCKHENLSIIEFSTASTEHYRELDGTWIHDSDFGDYTGVIGVDCRQCGFKKLYHGKYPKWLKSRMDEFVVTGYDVNFENNY